MCIWCHYLVRPFNKIHNKSCIDLRIFEIKHTWIEIELNCTNCQYFLLTNVHPRRILARYLDAPSYDIVSQSKLTTLSFIFRLVEAVLAVPTPTESIWIGIFRINFTTGLITIHWSGDESWRPWRPWPGSHQIPMFCPVSLPVSNYFFQTNFVYRNKCQIQWGSE